MKKIEIDTTIIHVPEGWDDIILGDYETWYHRDPKNGHERVELVADICKIESSVLKSYPIGVFNLIADTLAFAFKADESTTSSSLTVNGVKYVVPIAEELTLAAWVDAEEAQKGNAVLSNTLAITCLPVGETYDPAKAEERQRMFASLKVSEVLPVLGFFLQYKKALDQRIAMFSRVAESATLFVKNTATFPAVGGGIRLSTIWRAVRYFVIVKSLRYQLRKFLRSLDSGLTKAEPITHKSNL